MVNKWLNSSRDLSVDANSPFRDASNKLVRRSYWMGVTDKTLATVMTQGIGENLTNDEKRAHLIDLKREHLIDQVCSQKFCRLRTNVTIRGGFHARIGPRPPDRIHNTISVEAVPLGRDSKRMVAVFLR